jgi:hypothetical protein
VTDNVALTIDVTGQNIPPIVPSTDWLFVEAIDTLRSPPPWDVADFQCLLRRLRTDGFYLFEAAVNGRSWMREEPRSRNRAEMSLCLLQGTSLPALSGRPAIRMRLPMGLSVRLLAVRCSTRGPARNLRAEGIAGVLLEQLAQLLADALFHVPWIGCIALP